MRAQWESEKETLSKIQEKRGQLDHFRRELEDAENRYDLNKAAELRHGKIPAMEAELKKLEAAITRW